MSYILFAFAFITFICILIQPTFAMFGKSPYTALDGCESVESTSNDMDTLELPMEAENLGRRLKCDKLLSKAFKDYVHRYEEPDFIKKKAAKVQAAYHDTADEIESFLESENSEYATKFNTFLERRLEQILLWKEYINMLIEKSADGELDTVTELTNLGEDPRLAVIYNPSKLKVRYFSLKKHTNIESSVKKSKRGSEEHANLRKISNIIFKWDEIFKSALTDTFSFLIYGHCVEVEYQEKIVSPVEGPSLPKNTHLPLPSSLSGWDHAVSETQLPLLLSKDRNNIQCEIETNRPILQRFRNTYIGTKLLGKPFIAEKQLARINEVQHISRQLIKKYLPELLLESKAHDFQGFPTVKAYSKSLMTNSDFVSHSFIAIILSAMPEEFESPRYKEIILERRQTNKSFMEQVKKAIENLKKIFMSNAFKDLENPLPTITPNPITFKLKKNDFLVIKWERIFRSDILVDSYLPNGPDETMQEKVFIFSLIFKNYERLQAFYIQEKVLELWKDICSSRPYTFRPVND